MNPVEKLYQRVKRYGTKRTKSKHVRLGHLSWNGDHQYSYFKLKLRGYTLNASEERYDGGSLVDGHAKEVVRTLTIRSTHQIFSARKSLRYAGYNPEEEQKGWQIERGSIPASLLKR